MKRLEILVVILVLFSPLSAGGSYFEFCDFEGQILSVTLAPKDTYELSVDVIRATKSKKHGVDSYTDCSEYIGKPENVTFNVSELLRVPAAGDSIWFSRSVIDGFGVDGSYAGTSVNTHLRKLQKARPAANGR